MGHVWRISDVSHVVVSLHRLGPRRHGREHIHSEFQRIRLELGVDVVDALALEWPGSVVPLSPGDLEYVRWGVAALSPT